MISQNILEKLNRQVNLEAVSSHLYLQMSAWLLSQELGSTATFFRRHAEEEKLHMMKLFDYINETGALALIGDVPIAAPSWASHMELLEAAYAHELKITASINDVVDAALQEKDYSTFAFLQWYVAEQHEEEHLFGTLLHKARIIHTVEGRALFRFDEEVRKSVLGHEHHQQQPMFLQMGPSPCHHEKHEDPYHAASHLRH
ncbi:MAG TPA: ferritin [Chlorobium sp.]|uniref:Ferritin n=1 Tax=Chlorobium phaeovibrioides (strain DSM 265 / 1930) TaxID=290318 RepID=A4SDI8_CHLPM|nr:ferritin [Chlorobium sp.]